MVWQVRGGEGHEAERERQRAWWLGPRFYSSPWDKDPEISLTSPPLTRCRPPILACLLLSSSPLLVAAPPITSPAAPPPAAAGAAAALTCTRYRTTTLKWIDSAHTAGRIYLAGVTALVVESLSWWWRWWWWSLTTPRDHAGGDTAVWWRGRDRRGAQRLSSCSHRELQRRPAQRSCSLARSLRWC